jgi:WD40 repeat protein
MLQGFQDAFISYGRADSKAFATRLYQYLTERGFKIWFDQNDIPLAVNFQDQIDDGLAKSDNFLFIIAPHAVNSAYCRKEIDLAVRYNKRIIPIWHVPEISEAVWQERYPDQTLEDCRAKGLRFSDPRNINLHSAIAPINWIYCRENLDDFETALAGLLDIFARHRDYVKQHTYLLSKALEWEHQQKQNYYLLTGEERQRAEQWLKVRFKDEQAPCVPTTLHCEFITESIKNANNLMTDIFLSFAEEDKPVAKQIRDRLWREGFTIWPSETDIQTGENFQAAIRRGIEVASNIIYLLSPAALQSTYCQQEIEYALSLNKRIIPILLAAVDINQLASPLQRLQYLDLTDNSTKEDTQQDESQLVRILRHNASYHEKHKILLVKALKWDRQYRNPAILLRGYDLRDAEAWLKMANNDPQYSPISLQQELITESLRQPPLDALDVFISYSRSDSGLARQLNDELQIHGKTTWFDQESIAMGTDFEHEIYRGIESSNNILFILSPRSINSPHCAGEVNHAVKLNKRIITVLCQPISTDELHPELAKIQWLDFNHPDRDFYGNFTQLLRTLDTDRDHVQSHTKWLQRSIEWEQKQRSEDLLLRGSELTIALDWLQQALMQEKKPAVTPLQQDFIGASHSLRDRLLQEEEARKHKELRRARRTLVGAIVALVCVTGSALFAGRQWLRAEKGQVIAITQQSEALFSNRYGLDSLLTALQAASHLKQLPFASNDSQLRADVMQVLGQGIFWIKERNQLAGHLSSVQTVSFSSDNQMMATASYDHTIKLWGLNGQLIRTLEGHQGAVMGVCFIPDRSQLVSVSLDGTMKLWDRDTGAIIRTIPKPASNPYSMAVSCSPDGRKLVTGGEDGRIRLWDINGTLLKTFSGHQDAVTSVSFSANSNQIASASWDKTAKLWDLNGKLLANLQGHTGKVTSVSFDPKSGAIATASLDGSVRLWDSTGKLLKPVNRVFPLNLDRQEGLLSVSFNPTGGLMAVSSDSGSIKLFTADGQELISLGGHWARVNSTSFSPDGAFLASASNDQTVKLWQLKNPWTTTIRDYRTAVSDAQFSPDGQLLATVDYSATVLLRDASGALLHTLKRHQDAVSSLSFSPDSMMLASGDRAGVVNIWNRQGKWLLALPQRKGEQINSISFSPTGSSRGVAIAVADSAGLVQLWDVQGKVILSLPKQDSSVWSVAFSPDGQAIATGTQNGMVRLWNWNGQRIKEWRGHQGDIFHISFSPDAQRIATASSDKTVKLWDLNGHLLHSLVGHGAAVNKVSFSPDGRVIATGSDDQKIKLWSTNDGTLITTLGGHTGEVNSVNFNPKDGTRLASASTDATVLIWNLGDLQLETWVERGCDWVQNYLNQNPDALVGLCVSKSSPK